MEPKLKCSVWMKHLRYLCVNITVNEPVKTEKRCCDPVIIVELWETYHANLAGEQDY